MTGNARPPELLSAAAECSGLAGRGRAEGPGASSGWRRRGGLAQREVRRSGAGLRARAAGEPPPPSEVVRATTGARSFPDGSDSAGVPEPAVKVLSSARVAREVGESIRTLARTWRTGRGVSWLFLDGGGGLEVLKKIGKEGRSGGVRLARGHHQVSRNGLRNTTRNGCSFPLLFE